MPRDPALLHLCALLTKIDTRLEVMENTIQLILQEMQDIDELTIASSEDMSVEEEEVDVQTMELNGQEYELQIASSPIE